MDLQKAVDAVPVGNKAVIRILCGEWKKPIIAKGKKLTARNINIIKKIAERTQIIETGVEELVNARKVATTHLTLRICTY